MPIVQIGSFGEGILEQGQSFASSMAKAAAQVPSDLAKATVSQVTGSAGSSDQTADAASKAATDAADKDFVKDLYAPSTASASQTQHNQTAGQPDPTTPHDAKTPLEQAQMDETRRKLDLLHRQHKEVYYDPTFNRPQKQEESKAEEQEREEQEKQMEMMEEEKDKLPQLPVGTHQGTGEKLGVSG